MTCHYPDLGSASDWSYREGIFALANQKHYPDLSSDTSSVWNFCARSSFSNDKLNSFYIC